MFQPMICVNELKAPLYQNWRMFFLVFVRVRCMETLRNLGGGFEDVLFYFHPYLGKWSNLTNIFQLGWNHQLGN